MKLWIAYTFASFTSLSNRILWKSLRTDKLHLLSILCLGSLLPLPTWFFFIMLRCNLFFLILSRAIVYTYNEHYSTIEKIFFARSKFIIYRHAARTQIYLSHIALASKWQKKKGKCMEKKREQIYCEYKNANERVA